MMHTPDIGYFDGARATILRLQNADGSIPWFKGGVIDPWNHLEATMGLHILGERAAAEKAIAYLQNSQLEDGSWWGQLGSAVPIDMELHQFTTEGMITGHQVRDTNFTAYIATAAYHHYLTFQDMTYTQDLWPCVEAAITFVLGLQYDEGDIRWTARDAGTPEEDSLVTGNSSIYKSLGHAIKLGTLLEQPVNNWRAARDRLGHALAHRPERFDRTWGSKARYSMDWYYPVLSRALDMPAAAKRLQSRWDNFVIDGFGCRCVSDEPWVTVAESAELVLALMASGKTEQAATHLGWLDRFRDADGAYWMGMQVEEETFWPVEQPAWTAGAVLLAHDAVHQMTPAHGLFIENII